MFSLLFGFYGLLVHLRKKSVWLLPISPGISLVTLLLNQLSSSHYGRYNCVFNQLFSYFYERKRDGKKRRHFGFTVQTVYAYASVSFDNLKKTNTDSNLRDYDIVVLMILQCKLLFLAY